MKKLSKTLILLCMTFCLLFVSGCSKLEITEDMQKSIDEYIAAVTKSETRTQGKVRVTSILEDSAIEFKTTKSVIEYDYKVVDDKVEYERVDYTDDVESAKYKSDGTTVMKFDYETGAWVDKTEENSQFITTDSNPFITLSLFRVDSKTKLNTSYLTDIKSYEQDSCKVIEFTLDDSTVTDVLGFYKADGIARQSAGHTRAYYINSEGFITKVIVSTVQNIISNGEVGLYKTEMIVTCE